MNSRSRLGWTFAITSLALFAFALDRLVVAIALPAIRADLGAQVSGLEWTVNAYTLSFAVLLLTGGALGDRFGRRRMFTIGVAVFTAGSAAAALAPTIGVLVAARAVQGAGGALFTPLTLTMSIAVLAVMARSQFTSGPPAGSNVAQARQARRKASWTTSSARSGSTTIRRARVSRRA